MEQFSSLEQRVKKIEELLLSHKTVLTFDEVAIYTGLSKSYLYKLTSRSDIPFYRPNGKQLYFNKEEVDSWLLRNRVKTNQEIQSEASSAVVLRSRRR